VRQLIKIIESSDSDLDALQHLFFKTRRETFLWVDASEFNLSDFQKETKGEYILAAYADKMLVGFVSVWAADNFIHHLYVDENYQNQNIGTQLLKAVIDKFNLPLRLKCQEKNTRAVCFYKRKGFIEKERGYSETGPYILFELNEKSH
jgi:GNAT superfamily N-acetyltransferase